MKKFILLAFFIPVFAKAQFTIVNTSTINLVELRAGTWPLNLQRVIKESDTVYVLQFRDQQYTNSVNMSTIRFRDLEQLKYFQKGLSTLKKGSTGDIAKYKDYSVKRVDLKRDGIWYLLTSGEGPLTNFEQSEADKMIAAIINL